MAMRAHRKRRDAANSKLIRSIYWYEVHHPTIPISQYRSFGSLLWVQKSAPIGDAGRKIDDLRSTNIPALELS